MGNRENAIQHLGINPAQVLGYSENETEARLIVDYGIKGAPVVVVPLADLRAVVPVEKAKPKPKRGRKPKAQKV